MVRMTLWSYTTLTDVATPARCTRRVFSSMKNKT